MKLHCKITVEDFTRAQFLNMRPSPIVKWAGILIIASAIMIGLHQLIFPPGGIFTWKPLTMLAGLASIVVYFWIVLPRSAKKTYEQQKSLSEPFELELTDEAWEIVSAYGTARIPWADFRKYKVSDDMILIYQSDAQFMICPRSWFTDEQFADFKAILQRHLGKPKV